jgi:hypothetical protein
VILRPFIDLGPSLLDIPSPTEIEAVIDAAEGNGESDQPW